MHGRATHRTADVVQRPRVRVRPAPDIKRMLDDPERAQPHRKNILCALVSAGRRHTLKHRTVRGYIVRARDPREVIHEAAHT
jgi:hypothetical protein